MEAGYRLIEAVRPKTGTRGVGVVNIFENRLPMSQNEQNMINTVVFFWNLMDWEYVVSDF